MKAVGRLVCQATMHPLPTTPVWYVCEGAHRRRPTSLLQDPFTSVTPAKPAGGRPHAMCGRARRARRRAVGQAGDGNLANSLKTSGIRGAYTCVKSFSGGRGAARRRPSSSRIRPLLRSPPHPRPSHQLRRGTIHRAWRRRRSSPGRGRRHPKRGRPRPAP